MNNNSSEFSLSIKNYRCFSDLFPARIEIRNGFTSFVGINNAGKSTLLKFFYEFKVLFSAISSINNAALQQSIVDRSNFSLSPTVKDMDEIFNNTNMRPISLEIRVNPANIKGKFDGELPEKVIIILPREGNYFSMQIFVNGNVIGNAESNLRVGRKGQSNLVIGNREIYLDPYCQIFNDISRMVYVGAFRNAINNGGSSEYYDMTVGQNFVSLWDTHKSGEIKNSIKFALKITEDIKNVFKYNNLEINASNDNKTLHIIIDGKPYRLEELGSGLAQFIVVLANIAIRKPSWVLIDEPELNLHPALQIDFLTTLASYAENGVIFATHNFGLARSCSERIYSVKLNEKNFSEVKDFETVGSLSEFLGELSYSGYNDIGYKKLLLVEGSTEVKTIQQLLRKFGKDQRILLLSLGGSNMIKAASDIELNELKRINSDICALIDSEKIKENDLISKERLDFIGRCKEIGIECHVLERRATENYLSERAVKLVKGEKYRALTRFERLEDCPLGWGKSENWRIAREMTKDELANTDLGDFIESL